MTAEQQQALATIRSWPREMQEQFEAEMRARIRRMMAPNGGRPQLHVSDMRQDTRWWDHTLALMYR